GGLRLLLPLRLEAADDVAVYLLEDWPNSNRHLLVISLYLFITGSTLPVFVGFRIDGGAQRLKRFRYSGTIERLAALMLLKRNLKFMTNTGGVKVPDAISVKLRIVQPTTTPLIDRHSEFLAAPNIGFELALSVTEGLGLEGLLPVSVTAHAVIRKVFLCGCLPVNEHLRRLPASHQIKNVGNELNFCK